MESRVRMKDIAERAGVSVVTVSKALSGMHGVSEQKRREIENLARKMGYVHPDQDARSGRQESDICVLTAERFFRVAPSMYKRMLELLSEEADSACCRLRSSFASDRMIREGTIPDEIVSGGEDGVIILGELGRVYRDRLLSCCTLPFVFLDSTPPENQDGVLSDGFYGAYRLTNYLFDRGLSRIAYVGTVLSSGPVEERYLGYTRSMLEHEVKIPEKWVVDDRHPENGKMAEMDIALLPEAFVCSSDYSAAVLYRELQERGIRCPEDVSIVCFDNFHYPDPALLRFTAYETDCREMAFKALWILQRRIRGDSSWHGYHIISGRIVERGSVLKNVQNAHNQP